MKTCFRWGRRIPGEGHPKGRKRTRLWSMASDKEKNSVPTGGERGAKKWGPKKKLGQLFCFEGRLREMSSSKGD